LLTLTYDLALLTYFFGHVTQVMTLEELEMIAELCRKHDVIVISDEVYEWLVYPPQQHIRIGL